MNPYTMLGSGLGSNGASSLSARLSAWHDAMVAHERRLRTGSTGDVCDDDCPHADARALWSEAIAAFGSRAQELAFLRSRANATGRRSKGGSAAGESMSVAADRSHQPDRTHAAHGHRTVSVSPDGAPVAAEA